MTTSENPGHPTEHDDDHDQDAEPPTSDGGPAERVDRDDPTPGSDPDPEPGAESGSGS